MPFDDLKLIFETERRILKRRLKDLLGRGTSEEPQPEPEKTRPRRPRSSARPDAAEPSAESAPGRRPPRPQPSRHSGPAPRREAPHPNAGADSSPPTPKKKRSLDVRSWLPTVNFMVSSVVHVMILLMLLPYWAPKDVPEEKEFALSVRFIAPEKPQTPKPTPPAPDPQEEEEKEEEETKPPPAKEPEEVVEPPTKEAPEEPAPELAGTGGGGTPAESSEPSKIGSRSGEKSEALRVFGGGDETEVAVAEGLRWLAKHQDRTGAWAPARFTRNCPAGRPCGGPGHDEYAVGLTGLVILAFLGAGVDGTSDHEYRDVVRGGLDYLLVEQDSDGCFGERRGNYMYNHSIALFCLAEAALMTEDPRYLAAVGRGLSFSAESQQPGGGWDYTAQRTLRNDLSITGWQIMAIYTAEQADLPIDRRMRNRVRRYVSRTVKPSGWATYADRGMGKGRGGISIAAVGLLSKLYLGWSPRSPQLLSGARKIMRHPPDADARVDWRTTFQSTYYWYYATLTMFHIGGDLWDAWNTLLKRTILPMQREEGHRKGSWDPDPNWLGGAGGRVAATALNVLSLEVYYRYKPLYRKFGINEKKPDRP